MPVLVGLAAVFALAARPPEGAKALRITVDAARTWSTAMDSASPGPGTAPRTDRIHPAWGRQNVWMPWARWNPDDSASLPRFDDYVREVALIMATGHRPDTNHGVKPPRDISVPDLYQVDSAGRRMPFDPRHPFFSALRRFKALGIRPVIDLGPVPRALCRKPAQGPFGWNTAGPADHRKNHDYMRDLFLFLQGPAGFTRDEVAGWKFQLYREPDNHEVWDPKEAGHSLAGSNLEEFKILYDHTLAAMRAAGLRNNLAFGNLMVAYPGVWIFKDSWIEPLCRHLADTAGNRAPGLLKLPRISSPDDTLLFSFTAYGGHHTQLEDDPRALARITTRFRAIVRGYFPRNPLEITVGEGNLFSRQLHHRSDGSELGAAWTAGIYKISQDVGLVRYQQWGFASATHASRYNEHGGIQGGPYNVVQMYRKLETGKRLSVVLDPRDPLAAPAYADAIAALSPDSVIRVLIFHYHPERGGGRPLPIALDATGVITGRDYIVRHFRVDKDQGQYLNRWHQDLKAAGETLQIPFDACMEYQFTPTQWLVWHRHRADYQGLALLSTLPTDSLTTLRSDARGRLRKNVTLPPNSVSLLEFRPATPAGNKDEDVK